MNLEYLDQVYTKLTPNKAQWDEEKKNVSLEALLRSIEFKTGGMRGLMREGFNGINEVTANILATQLCKRFDSIVIGYDHRRSGERLAYVFLKVFALNGKNVVIYRHCITPYLAMESEQYDVGLMITASHNPKEYNGFKIYQEGSQITTEVAQSIQNSLKSYDFTEIYDRGSGTFESPDWKSELDSHTRQIDFKRYFSNYGMELSVNKHTVVPVFSALHGVSLPFIREACKHFGIRMNTDSRHNQIDGDFSQVPFPNPEVEENWHALYDEMLSAGARDGFLFMIDPDGDRFGMAGVEDGKLVIYNANAIIKVFTWYFLRKYDPSEIILVNTFLCDGFFKAVSEKLGIKYRQTETGFKNVAKGIRELLKESEPCTLSQDSVPKGEAHEGVAQGLEEKLAGTSITRKAKPFAKHVIAYEDTLGYILGTSKEKDGVLASIVMYHILQEHRVSDIFDDLKIFGTYASYTVHLRVNNPEDVLRKITELKPFTRVYDAYSMLEDGFSVYLRVSGTESMIKVYTFSNKSSYNELRAAADWWILKNVLCFCRENCD